MGIFFSIRIVFVLFVVRVVGMAPSAGAKASLALEFLLVMMFLFESFDPRHDRFRRAHTRTLSWVFAFLAISICSLAWSETASWMNSLAYWCGITGDVALVILLLRRREAATVAHSMMKGFVWATCALAVIAWMMPAQADLRLGDPEFFNSNQIGNACAFAIFFAQYLARRKDGNWGTATALLFVTLVRSLSKATLAAFLVSEAVLLIQDRFVSRRKKVLLIASAVSLVFVFWGLFEAYYEIYTTSGNQAETLTGRTAIWLYAVNAVTEHPWNVWIGHGFDSVWKVVPPFGPEQFEARHAENEVLQQMYAYGALGVALLAGLYGSLYRRMLKVPRRPERLLLLCLLLFVVVRGLAEAEPFDLLLPLWAIVMLDALVGGGGSLGEEPGPELSIGDFLPEDGLPVSRWCLAGWERGQGRRAADVIPL